MPTTTTTQPAELISLAGVAELARVKRPVVSMWRSRFEATDAPFPSPADRRSGRDLFDPQAVAAWLRETGHGNNPDAVADAAASALVEGLDLADPAHVAEVTALIALRAWSGGSLEPLGSTELTKTARRADPLDALMRAEIERHAERGAPWRAYVDRLVDAAYSAAAAFDAVAGRHAATLASAGSAGPLRADAETLVTLLTAELARDLDHEATVRVHAALDPRLAIELVGACGEDAPFLWPGGDRGRGIRRRLLCEGLAPLDSVGAGPAVHLTRVPAEPGIGALEMLRAADDLVLELGDDDRALIVGPARVLVDALAGEAEALRSLTLRTGQLRAVVRLGSGLVTSAPHEALALWVLGAATRDVALADRRTAVADLTDVTLTPARRGDLVADVLAALGSRREMRAHAFRFARPVRTATLLARRGSLVTDAPTSRRPHRSVRDLPALVDAARAELGPDAPATGWSPRRADDDRLELTVAAAIAARHVRVLPGTRVAADEHAVQGLTVVSADDLFDPQGIGARRIDALAFAARHPSSVLTQPDDVVFVTAPEPRAWVDAEGSKVVAYPARVLRISAADPGGLVPELVAADLTGGRSEPGAWRRRRLRTVDPNERAPLRAALAEMAETRTALIRRLDALTRFEGLLTEAVAVRAVTLTAPDAADAASDSL